MPRGRRAAPSRRAAPGGAALLHHAAAAERDRQPAHGPRARPHDPGHAGPLPPDARRRRALAARHRPCRHRDPDGGRARSWRRRAATRAARARPRGVRRQGLGVEGAQSGGTIARQMRRLGASSDWSRERFTMDAGPVAGGAARCSSALRGGPDLPRQAPGQLGLPAADRGLRPRGAADRGRRPPLAPPLPDRGHATARIITVATTRPETMLGDTAVAVHPDDERYRHLHGRHAVLPLVGRRSRSSPTPTPTPRRARAPSRSPPPTTSTTSRSAGATGLRRSAILDERGPRSTTNAPEPYRGLDRFEARKRVVADLEAQGSWSRSSRTATPSARRPLRHAARAAPHRPVVLRRQAPGPGGDRRGRGRAHPLRARALGEHLLRVDAQHPALVHLAPALVGPPDPGLVRPGRPGVRRRERGRRRTAAARATTAARRGPDAATRTCSTPGSPPACGRSPPSAGRTRRPSSSASTRPACWSPASTSSSSGSPG